MPQMEMYNPFIYSEGNHLWGTVTDTLKRN